jgi:hypothetical protein
MKTIIVLISIIMLFAVGAIAQENNIGVFGLGFSPTADPGVIGFGAYGRIVAPKTAVFTDYDVERARAENANFNVAGLRLKYSIRTGVAYQLKQITPTWSVWGLFNGGMAADGISVVRSLQYGGFLDKGIGKGIGIMLILAAEDNPITGRDFAPRIGLRVKF